MADNHPTIEDAVLGTLTRDVTEFSDGEVLTHDWYTGALTTEGGAVELVIKGTSPNQVAALLPRVREVVSRLGSLQRLATDAIVTEFSTGEPAEHELEDGASDLVLETLEATSAGPVVLHFTDECGKHFPEGYWPAVHLDDEERITQVTVEA